MYLCRFSVMEKKFLRRLVMAAPIWMAVALTAQEPGTWRFWTVADGLHESYTRTISISDSGKAFLRHGSVNSMTILDGYSVVSIPDPSAAIHKEGGPTRTAYGRVYESASGDLWNVDFGRLRHYENQRWVVHKLRSNPAALVLAAIPIAGGDVLV